MIPSLSNAQPVPGWKPYWQCNNPYNAGWAPPEIVDAGVRLGQICTEGPKVEYPPINLGYYELGKFYRNPYNSIIRVLAKIEVSGIEYFVLEQMTCNGGLVGRLSHWPVNSQRKSDWEVEPVYYDTRCAPLQNSLAWEYFNGR